MLLGACATEDVPLPRRRAILYENNFEHHSAGLYTQDLLHADWDVTGGHIGIEEGRAEILQYDEARGQVLRVRYPAGEWGRDGMVQFRHDLGGSYEEIWAAYSFRMAEGFEFNKGGKLPGPAGGKGNTGGDRPDGYDGWSARMMWRGDYLVSYVYHPNQPDGAFGENMLWKRIRPARWYHTVTYVRMNTVGNRDGVIRGWLDGELVLERSDLEFRRTDAFAIDHYLFSTFYGGADSTWAPREDNYIYFDDFRFWTRR
jgi:hypothetical protein